MTESINETQILLQQIVYLHALKMHFYDDMYTSVVTNHFNILYEFRQLGILND